MTHYNNNDELRKAAAAAHRELENTTLYLKRVGLELGTGDVLSANHECGVLAGHALMLAEALDTLHKLTVESPVRTDRSIDWHPGWMDRVSA